MSGQQHPDQHDLGGEQNRQTRHGPHQRDRFGEPMTEGRNDHHRHDEAKAPPYQTTEKQRPPQELVRVCAEIPGIPLEEAA
jgi:hypothetical protein